MSAGLLEHPPAAPQANAVRLEADARRLPPAPSFIEPLPRSLVAYADVAALADRIALLLQGRGYTLEPGFAALPGLDTFPKVTVYANGLTRAEAQWLGAAVLLSPGGRLQDLDTMHEALEAALERRGGQ